MDTNDSEMSRRLAIALVAAAAAACKRTPTLQELDHVRAKRSTGPLPKSDPASALWDTTSEFSTALAPQNVTPPMIQQPGVSRVKVRALHDGTWIAFRLQWTDAARDDVHGPSRFSDAAAVQVPREANTQPSPMMGQPGSPVRILFWKAAWQTADHLAALHPNRPPTDYPYLAAPPEHRARMETSYAPAVNAHNPNFHKPGDPPLFLGEAEMFGSLTGLRDMEVDGRGVYAERSWRVVLATKIANLGNAVRPGRDSTVAFAVWEGAAQNAGGRKMRSEQWARLAVE
jgi:DMSO reductase family type II enzyme heme b subunit